jgi:hypothetical protein
LGTESLAEESIPISGVVDIKDDFRQTTLAELRRLPIPTFSRSVAAHRELAMLVERMLGFGKRINDARLAHEKTLLQRQVDAVEQQIDLLVYELYGLTEDEIRQVRGE